MRDDKKLIHVKVAGIAPTERLVEDESLITRKVASKLRMFGALK